MKENKYATLWKEVIVAPHDLYGKSRVIARNSILFVASKFARKTKDNFLRCLFCHYVFDDQKKDFEKIITELKNIGSFINTDTCIKMLEGKIKIDNKYFHLSFDDGFRNNFTNALPILKLQKVPAIFFVPSSLIEANYEDARYYCRNTTQYNAVIEMLKWNDLHEILSYGYEIGSHTKTHARFSDISINKSKMEDEILGSKKELEHNLNYECKYISYPFGRLADADNESLKFAKEAGYKACFGAHRGTVRSESSGKFSIPRHHFEPQWPMSHIKYFVLGNMEREI